MYFSRHPATRPAWSHAYTLAEFFATALLLGPLFGLALNNAAPPWVRSAAVSGGVTQLAVQILKFLWLSRAETFELRASSLLLSGLLRHWFLARLAILAVAGIAMPLSAAGAPIIAGTFALALAGEWMGRYLFFVSVVPKNVAAAFGAERMAA